MLTHKQQELLIFINERLAQTGISPSFDEMKNALDLRSKSGIHRLIMALEERGFIRRLPNRARALEVLKMPKIATSGDTSGNTMSGFEPTVIDGGMPNVPPNVPPAANDEQMVGVPLMGRIAAGVPIEAIQNQTDLISVSPSMLKGGEHFALEVQGDSMVDEGILEGDIVLIQRTPTATPGDIVVALVENEEATLKRFKRDGDSIALEPANESYETKIYGPDKVEVQGCLVGLVRKY